MGLITIADLLARPGFSDIDSTEAASLIDDASALVREATTPELDDVEAPDAPKAVVAVMANMIRRGATNPLAAAQETLGDYSRSMGGGDGGVASLYMTRRERRIVRRAAGKLGAGSLDMTGDIPRQLSEDARFADSDDLL